MHDKKILIVQLRTDASEPHDRVCYLKHLSHCADRLVFVNGVRDTLYEKITPDIAGVIIGGSGQFHLTGEDSVSEWYERLSDFVALALSRDVPLLGVCFGEQTLAHHFGCPVIHDEAMAETGTVSAYTLTAAASDPLFHDLPAVFDVNMGHKDTAVDIPTSLIPLARTDRVAVCAFRVAGKLAWGVLFHIELSRECMRERMHIFPDYADKVGDLDEFVEKNIRETPEAVKILTRFVDLSLSGDMHSHG